MALDFQAQLDALTKQLAGKADLDPKTGKLQRNQTADATPADVEAWLAAGIAPGAAPTATPVAAGTNLLLPATVAALAAGVKAPGSTPQPVALAPGKYVLSSTNAVTGYDIGVKFLRSAGGADLQGTFNKLQNGAQTITFAVAETGTFLFAVVASSSSATLAAAVLTKVG